MSKQKGEKEVQEIELKICDYIVEGITSDEKMSKKLSVALETDIPVTKVEEIKKGMYEKGIIYDRPVIDPLKVNKKISIFHFYKCRGGPKQISEAAKQISNLPFVEEIHSVVGQYDLIVKFRVSTMDEYNHILDNDIWTIIEAAGIVNSMGIVSIHTYFEKASYEIEEFVSTKRI